MITIISIPNEEKDAWSEGVGVRSPLQTGPLKTTIVQTYRSSAMEQNTQKKISERSHSSLNLESAFVLAP